jgi:hypothetical protein
MTGEIVKALSEWVVSTSTSPRARVNLPSRLCRRPVRKAYGFPVSPHLIFPEAAPQEKFLNYWHR